MIKQPLTIEYALLGFLRQQPMHAYEIHQTLLRAEALGLVWHIKQSLVYVMLERLEAEGYITASIEPQGSRPPRKLIEFPPDVRLRGLTWSLDGSSLLVGRQRRTSDIALFEPAR